MIVSNATNCSTVPKPFQKFPYDLLPDVFDFLCFADLSRTGQVSKLFNKNAKVIWLRDSFSDAINHVAEAHQILGKINTKLWGWGYTEEQRKQDDNTRDEALAKMRLCENLARKSMMPLEVRCPCVDWNPKDASVNQIPLYWKSESDALELASACELNQSEDNTGVVVFRAEGNYGLATSTKKVEKVATLNVVVERLNDLCKKGKIAVLTVLPELNQSHIKFLTDLKKTVPRRSGRTLTEWQRLQAEPKEEWQQLSGMPKKIREFVSYTVFMHTELQYQSCWKVHGVMNACAVNAIFTHLKLSSREDLEKSKYMILKCGNHLIQVVRKQAQASSSCS